MDSHLFGLIGWPLGHSFSKKYFTEKFERAGLAGCRYELFEIEKIDVLPKILVQNPSLRGLNVTIPHKQTVIPFLNEIDTAAREIGAVNCIRIDEKGKTRGFNSDVIGFEKSLENWLGSRLFEPNLKALIFGSGGAAKAVSFVLKQKNIPFQVVSRQKGQMQYSDLDEKTMVENLLLINATPLGTFPKTAESPPIPFHFLNEKHCLFDLIYNPSETVFLREGRQKGCLTKNGLEMLELQAEAAWAIFSPF